MRKCEYCQSAIGDGEAFTVQAHSYCSLGHYLKGVRERSGKEVIDAVAPVGYQDESGFHAGERKG